MDHEKYMKLAIEKTKEGIEQGQTPFGACIVKDGVVLAVTHNTVWKDTDITAHAEINAIREACKTLGAVDLSGCILYSTCEPCPMCLAASHWARISKVFFGALIRDAIEFGFNELTLFSDVMTTLGHSPLELEKGFMKEDCVNLFKLWKHNSCSRCY